jgi:hypothetical protein
MTDRAYIVVPFARNGVLLGPGQPLIFDAMAKASFVANQLAPRVAGVAIIERCPDPETGDATDRLIAEIGAIPPHVPSASDWTVRLN